MPRRSLAAIFSEALGHIKQGADSILMSQVTPKKSAQSGKTGAQEMSEMVDKVVPKTYLPSQKPAVRNPRDVIQKLR